MEDALDSIEVAQESGDRAKVLEAARKAKRVLAETPEAITALDPEYWAQFPAAIKRMSAEAGSRSRPEDNVTTGAATEIQPKAEENLRSQYRRSCAQDFPTSRGRGLSRPTRVSRADHNLQKSRARLFGARQDHCRHAAENRKGHELVSGGRQRPIRRRSPRDAQIVQRRQD